MLNALRAKSRKSTNTNHARLLRAIHEGRNTRGLMWFDAFPVTGRNQSRMSSAVRVSQLASWLAEMAHDGLVWSEYVGTDPLHGEVYHLTRAGKEAVR